MASKVAPVPGGGGGACLEPCKLRPPAAPGPNAGNHFDCVSINRGPKVRFRFGEAAMGHRSDDFAKSTPRVLVIEDDEDFGQAAVDALECAGMRTAWAANEADGMLLKRSFAPDVVLLDPGAPGTDGAGLLARIVRQGDCGVIAVSGAAAQLSPHFGCANKPLNSLAFERALANAAMSGASLCSGMLGMSS